MTTIALCVVSCLLVGFVTLFVLCARDYSKERRRANAAESKLEKQIEQSEIAMIGVQGRLVEQQFLVEKYKESEDEQSKLIAELQGRIETAKTALNDDDPEISFGSDVLVEF